MRQSTYAHTLKNYGEADWEPLRDHLQDVAKLARANAERFGWGGLASAAGLLHDIGKTSAQFQAYIRGNAPRGGDHATGGAREAFTAYGPMLGRLLALIIAGHHSGLADADRLDCRLASELPRYDDWRSHAAPLPTRADLQQTRTAPKSAYASDSVALSQSFLIQMLFSCLVDADFIANETFMRQKPMARGGAVGLPVLRDRLSPPHGVRIETARTAAGGACPRLGR